MKKHQSGFSHIAIFFVIVIIGVVGFAGWRVIANKEKVNKEAVATKRQQKTDNSQQSDEKTKEIAWVTYKDEEAGITFKYPENWKSSVNETLRGDDGDFWGVGGTVTSPDDNKLEWTYMLAGGRGGDCEPNQSDVAFSDGNKCSSKRILSVEKAQSVTMNPSSTHRNMFHDSLYITRTKYRSSQPNSKISYHICLDPYYDGSREHTRDDRPQVSTSMGLLFPCAFWSSGFNVRYDVDNESDFNSAESKIAEEIMKTFNSL